MKISEHWWEQKEAIQTKVESTQVSLLLMLQYYTLKSLEKLKNR